MRYNFVISLILVLLFVTPLWASGPRKLDPNEMQISSPIYAGPDESGRMARRDLGKAICQWLDTQSDTDGVECDRLADQQMEDNKGQVGGYVIASELANLRGNKDRAIAIIRDAAEKYPDTRSRYANIPLCILAHFYTAAFAKQAGDMATAKQEYEANLDLIKDMENKDERNYFTALCYLFLSEAEGYNPETFQSHISQLDSVSKLFVDWVTFEHARKTKGNAFARSHLALIKEETQPGAVSTDCMLKYSGVIQSEMAPLVYRSCGKKLEQIRCSKIKDFNSIDNSLICLHLAELNELHKNYAEAEKYYSLLFSQDCFLSVHGGIGLARCKKLRNMAAESSEIENQIKQKYPLVKFSIELPKAEK